MTLLHTLLELNGFKPCGDSLCVFGRRGGQMTNGGCQCVDKRDWPPEARRLIKFLAGIARKWVASQ